MSKSIRDLPLEVQVGQYRNAIVKHAADKGLTERVEQHFTRLGYGGIDAFVTNGAPDAEKVEELKRVFLAIYDATKVGYLLAAAPVAAPEPVAHTKKPDDSGEPLASFIPEVDPTFVLGKEMQNHFTLAWNDSVRRHQCLLFVGPRGCGKTEAAKQLAAHVKAPCFTKDMGIVERPSEMFGEKGYSPEKGTYYTTAQFIRCIEAGGHVIVLDEVSRCRSHIGNSLFPILDGRGSVFLEPLNRWVTVGKQTVFIGTINIGAEYTGTFAMDAALRDRFKDGVVLCEYLNPKDESRVLVERAAQFGHTLKKEDAESLVDLANTVRAKAVGDAAEYTQSISTRQLEAAAVKFAVAGPESLRFTLGNAFPCDGANREETEFGKVMALIQGKFPSVAATVTKKKRLA
jgi:MoxR-like ATPase